MAPTGCVGRVPGTEELKTKKERVEERGFHRIIGGSITKPIGEGHESTNSRNRRKSRALTTIDCGGKGRIKGAVRTSLDGKVRTQTLRGQHFKRRRREKMRRDKRIKSQKKEL